MATVIADFWYGSTINERHNSDLNERVENALVELVGERYLGMDGGSMVGVDFDEPNMADNNPMVEVESEEEAEELRKAIEAIVAREVTFSFFD